MNPAKSKIKEVLGYKHIVAYIEAKLCFRLSGSFVNMNYSPNSFTQIRLTEPKSP